MRAKHLGAVGNDPPPHPQHVCPCCRRPVAEPISELVPLEEIQRRLDLGREKTRQLIRDGELPSLYDGFIYRVPRAAFERWMGGRTSAADPDVAAADLARAAALAELRGVSAAAVALLRTLEGQLAEIGAGMSTAVRPDELIARRLVASGDD